MQSSSFDPWQWSGLLLLLSQSLCAYPPKWNNNHKIPLAAVSKSSTSQLLRPNNAKGQIWALEHHRAVAVRGCMCRAQVWQTSDAGNTQVDTYFASLEEGSWKQWAEKWDTPHFSKPCFAAWWMLIRDAMINLANGTTAYPNYNVNIICFSLLESRRDTLHQRYFHVSVLNKAKWLEHCLMICFRGLDDTHLHYHLHTINHTSGAPWRKLNHPSSLFREVSAVH